MTFLMMLYVILIYMLMTPLSTLRVIRYLISSNNYNWFLNLNLIYETLWTRAGSGLLISLLEKLIWFRLSGRIILVLLMWKWMGLFLKKNYLLWCRGCFSLLNWIWSLILSQLLKLPPLKLKSLYKSTLPTCSIVVSRLVLLVATWNC